MSERGGATVLFFWHDIWLPHSRFFVDKLDKCGNTESSIVLAGPAERTGASAIFTVAAERFGAVKNVISEYPKSYRFRETICRFREWVRLVKKYSPDVIFVADEGMSLNVLWAGIANFLFGRAVVLFYGFENIVQGVGWNDLSGSLTVRQFAICLRKAARRLVLETLLMPIRRRVVHGGLVSYKECADVLHSYRWNPVMVECWWPIDITAFKRGGSRRELRWNDGYVVGFVGRFIEEKGILLLVEAAKFVDANIRFVFVGDGPMRGKVVRRINALGLEERFEIIPPLDAEKLAEFYRSIDLLVLPSISTETWKEQFGRVLVEARCCGAKVAGSNSGAIPTVVRNADRIFSEGNVEQLAALIQREVRCGDGDANVASAVGPEIFMERILSLAYQCRSKMRE